MTTTNSLQIFSNALNNLIKLDKLEWEILAGFIELEEYREKEFLDIESKPTDKLYFLTSGALRVFRKIKNKECTYNLYITPRFVANFEALLTDKPAMHSIQALSDTTVVTLKYKDAQKLYDVFPKFDRIGRLLTESVLLQEVKRIDDITCFEPFERYQKLLHESPELIQKLPQKYIASYLGISPESLSRMKAKLIFEK